MKSIRSVFNFLMAALLVASPLTFASQKTKAPEADVKVIFFDVNETLLDLHPLQKTVGDALGGRPDLLSIWFSTMLHYSLVETSINQYHDFGQIGAAALIMVAQSNGLTITQDQAKKAIAPITSLPAHPDVRTGLEMLKNKGYKLVALTNSSRSTVEKQLKNAGLYDLFDEYLSGEAVHSYKPNLKVYDWAMQKIGVSGMESLLVAAHGWDVAGAKEAGMKTAFVARTGQAIYPLAKSPDYIVNDLVELSNLLPKR